MSQKNSAEQANGKKTRREASPIANTDKDFENAKDAGLPIAHYQALRSIVKGQDKGRSYREIEADTGYYSNLTAVCRAGKDGSLASAGLIKEVQHEGEPLRFVATTKGKKALSKT